MLSNLPAEPQHIQRVLILAVISTIVFFCLVPFAQVKLPPVWPFIPLYQSALVICDLITVALLIGQMRSSRMLSLGILAGGYFFSAAMTVAHTLSFPGLFAPMGLLGAGPQTTAWLYSFWHGIFPLFVIAYALTAADRRLSRLSILVGAAGLIAFCLALTWLATAGVSALPDIMKGNEYAPAKTIVLGSVWLSSVLAMIALIRKRPRTVLDTWIFMVLVVWVFDIALSAVFNGGRFDLGFYSGRIYGLIASVIVLCALLVETKSIYTRLSSAVAEMAASREREAGQRLINAVIKQLPEGVVIASPDGASVIANNLAADLLHIEAGQWINCPYSASTDDAVERRREQVSLRLQRLLNGDALKAEEAKIDGGEGTRILKFSGTTVLDEKDDLLACVLVFDDVTEKREDALRLQTTLAQTRSLIENTPLAVIEWDSKLSVTSWNERATELFGWTKAEIQGASLEGLAFIHEEDREPIAKLAEHIRYSELSYVISTHVHRTKAGGLCHVEWYTSVLRNPAGQMITAFSLILDITGRKKAIDQLNEADRRKDAYLAMLAHELRNPLAPIGYAVSLLRAKHLPPERLGSIVDTIDRQVRQMQRLLEDLLDIARITSGKVNIQVSQVDLTMVLKDAIDVSRPLIERAEHTLIVDLPDQQLLIDADMMRLTQVFGNLLNNAAKYTSRGGEIRLSVTEHGDKAVISVRDNGIGIDPAMLPSVFKPFVQVDSALELSQGGLGIGLALAKGIIELHGGTISAYSEGPGAGSEFRVTLGLSANTGLLRSAV